ncbi:hypothetical protein JTB14_037141 [Gonioctena quinquepunctata]|nr:hypothetical protein JTB14_037141 [Gonioctena quinquepunctata]
MLWMQDVANGKRTHPRDPDKYTDVYYAICQIWKKEIPEIWETYKVNVAKLGKVHRSNKNYMEDEYFNHLSNSETDEEIPEKSQKFRETEEKLEEIKTNKMSMPEVISGIHRLLAEGKSTEEKIAKEKKEIAKQNLPCLKIKPPPSRYLTVREPDGKVDKEKAAKNMKFEQGENKEKPVFANIVQTDGPTDLSSDDESIGLADKGDITKTKIIKPKIKRKKISSTPINTPETSEKRDATPQSPGTKKGKIQTEKETPPPIILEGKKMLEKTLEIKSACRLGQSIPDGASLVQSQVQAALAQQKLDFDDKFDCHIHEFAKQRQEFEAIKNELSSLKHPTKDSPVLLGVDGWLPETNTTSKTHQPP